MNLLTLERFKPRDLALFLHFGPLFLIFNLSLPDQSQFFTFRGQEDIIAVFFSILMIIGSGFLVRQKRIGRLLIHFCFLAGILLTLNHFYERPSRCLLMIVIALGGMKLTHSAGTFRLRSRTRQDALDYSEELIFFSAIFNLAIAAIVFFLAAATGPLIFGTVIYVNLMTLMLLSLASRQFLLSLRNSISLQIGLLLLVGLLIYFLPLNSIRRLSHFTVTIPFVSLFFGPIRRQLHHRIVQLIETLFLRPESAILIFFISVSTLGTLVLYSPLSSVNGGLSLIDSAFTAVSATCVTGLTIVDTAREFSFFGQLVILALIQIGGLGIMSMSSLFILMVGRRLTITQEEAVVDSVGTMLKGEVFSSLKQVLIVTFTAEAIGALILTSQFAMGGDSLGTAIWRGIFTSVSAFCNAGFALQSDSLIPYQNSPGILYTISILIILGGLSPAFIVMLPRIVKKTKIPLQFKMVAISNLVLLFVGALAYLILEWNLSLMGFSLSHKLHNAWFQSVTARTAGFNSVDLTMLQPATTFIMMTLMFIGGSPGGTAGGIKTTTFMILVFVILSVSRGRQNVTAFQRHISLKTIYRATTVAVLGVFIGFLGLISLLTTQKLEPLMALFEVVSALGTVGLSLGATSQLDYVGKFIIMMLMFLGRVGSLSVLIYLGQQTRNFNWKLPEEDVAVA